MNNETLELNIRRVCAARGKKVTPACVEAGVGSSFINDLQRGKSPSIWKVLALAQYLGVSVSELIGEAVPESGTAFPDAETARRFTAFMDALAKLTPEQQEAVLGMLRAMSGGK